MKLPLFVALAVATGFAVAMLAPGRDGDPAEVTVAAATASGGSVSAAGEIRFVRNANTPFDPYLGERDYRPFMREHYFRMRGYPPFFDPALKWAPPTHFYVDLYAVYPSDRSERRLFKQHPNWILRNEAGEPLYVPFACEGGTCPAYAADPGKRAYQRYWIAHARRDLEKGYAGLFIDNVNMIMRVGEGSGEEVPPVDPRTGQLMSEKDWQRYVARFVERIRRKLRGAEIVHNSIWFAERSDAVRRATTAADIVELERGFSDPGILDDGDGSTYRSFLEHVDWIHSQERAVMLEPYDLDARLREFELANYFLVNEGADMIVSDFEANPDNWWPGWDTDLGGALGPRVELEGGILRRDFEHGLVLVNPPGSPESRIAVPGSYTNLDGAPVSEVVLGPGEGAVLRSAA